MKNDVSELPRLYALKIGLRQVQSTRNLENRGGCSACLYVGPPGSVGKRRVSKVGGGNRGNHGEVHLIADPACTRRFSCVCVWSGTTAVPAFFCAMPQCYHGPSLKTARRATASATLRKRGRSMGASEAAIGRVTDAAPCGEIRAKEKQERESKSER